MRRDLVHQMQTFGWPLKMKISSLDRYGSRCIYSQSLLADVLLAEGSRRKSSQLDFVCPRVPSSLKTIWTGSQMSFSERRSSRLRQRNERTINDRISVLMAVSAAAHASTR